MNLPIMLAMPISPDRGRGVNILQFTRRPNVGVLCQFTQQHGQQIALDTGVNMLVVARLTKGRAAASTQVMLNAVHRLLAGFAQMFPAIVASQESLNLIHTLGQDLPVG
jgi:hypothetical protein